MPYLVAKFYMFTSDGRKAAAQTAYGNPEKGVCDKSYLQDFLAEGFDRHPFATHVFVWSSAGEQWEGQDFQRPDPSQDEYGPEWEQAFPDDPIYFDAQEEYRFWLEHQQQKES